MAVLDRLPGIYVDPFQPERQRRLPPMDVALFAGFAERGPCNQAIAVDSVAAFEVCFGGDFALACAADGHGALSACLPATVRAFFANGGLRCWVVRLARTSEVEKAWAAHKSRPERTDEVAATAIFPLSGMLCRWPSHNDGPSRVRRAWLQASSIGSWADNMQLAARVRLTPVRLDGLRKIATGLRFTDNGLAPGSLIELRKDNGAVRRFAKVVRKDGDDLLAIWCASFADVQFSSEAADNGMVHVPGAAAPIAAQLVNGTGAHITLSAPQPPQVKPGAWLHFISGNESVWMLVDAISTDGTATCKFTGPAWQLIASRLPAGGFHAYKVEVDIEARVKGDRNILAAPNPTMADENSLEALRDDQSHYAAQTLPLARGRAAFALRSEDRESQTRAYDSIAAERGFADAAAAFGTNAFTAAHRRALRTAWLPLGVGRDFAGSQGAVPDSRHRLQRDGLARFDAELFLDPQLADADTASLGAAISRLRDLNEARLIGIHAAAGIGETGFGMPSMLAVPDALHPGWELAADTMLPAAPRSGGLSRSDWKTHRNGCIDKAVADQEIAAPDFGHFLDCATAELDMPVFAAPAGDVASGNFRLSWTSTVPDGEFILEESQSAEFAGAAEIYRGTTAKFDISGRPEGYYYYRLRVVSGDNSSDWATTGVVVRASAYVATGRDDALLRTLHVATMRLAAGTADMFALLGLPDIMRGDDARAFIRSLQPSASFGTAERLGQQERRALSYGAIHHPWLSYRADRNFLSAKPVIYNTPPLGCVAGLMAATARQRGAWIAHANIAMTDIIGLSPSLPDDEQLPLYNGRANMVRQMPAGFMLVDNDTLSDEAEWKQITVRRLMILLRRIAIERGLTYVFEPHGPVLRRAIENDFSRMLDEMQRRGAFAGATSRQSFDLQVDIRPGDADKGQLVVEIGVAPSVPMRFLKLRLVQQGGRSSLVEEAA